MIRYENVVLAYSKAGKPAIDGVTLEAPASHLTAIVGPNGSGKSTLVRALLGRLRALSGRVLLANDSLHTLDRREAARRVGVVTQREEPVFPLAVRDFVALGRFAHGGPLSPENDGDRDAIREAMSRAGVDQLASRRTDELSGGEWQRARVARALAQQAPALVLDEPTTFLDLGHEMSVFELLASLASDGKAVLVVSHQLNLVARFASQLVLLDHGRVVAAGAPADVLRPDVLEPVYEWPLAVTNDVIVGAPAVIPLRTPHSPRNPGTNK